MKVHASACFNWGFKHQQLVHCLSLACVCAFIFFSLISIVHSFGRRKCVFFSQKFFNKDQRNFEHSSSGFSGQPQNRWIEAGWLHLNDGWKVFKMNHILSCIFKTQFKWLPSYTYNPNRITTPFWMWELIIFADGVKMQHVKMVNENSIQHFACTLQFTMNFFVHIFSIHD